MCVSFLFLYLLGITCGSNVSITYEDIVKSNYLFRKSPNKGASIGFRENDFSPLEYLELESRGINLYPVYKTFCRSLNSKEIWDQTMKEFNKSGENLFERIVDGECITLRAIKWMTLDEIEFFHAPPLYLTPFTKIVKWRE
jgi:hypothetical protein